MNTDKSVPVENLLPMIFIGVPTQQVIKGNIQGAWYPEISVAVIDKVGVPVEEDLADIGTKSRK